MTMTEILYLTIGILSGGIITYIITSMKFANTVNMLTDNLVKVRLLKEEMTKANKAKKSWKGSKKKYYGNKKKQSKEKS